MTQHGPTPIDPADVQIGMRIRVTHVLPAVGAWLAGERVAEGAVTAFPRDTRRSVYLDDDDSCAVTIIPNDVEAKRGYEIKVEALPWAMNTVILGHPADEDIAVPWIREVYGWRDVLGWKTLSDNEAEGFVIEKVLWTPAVTS